MQYLQGTKALKLRIEVHGLRVMRWFVDAAHMVHWDCKGQTGAAMTLGRGAVLSYSWKQKINTKSSNTHHVYVGRHEHKAKTGFAIPNRSQSDDELQRRDER